MSTVRISASQPLTPAQLDGLKKATHDQLTTLLGYDCGKSVPEYVVQMVKNGKTMGHIEKGLVELVGQGDAVTFVAWLGGQVSKITATGSHSTEVGLQMKIKHLEAELRRQKAETHQLKYALKDAAYENLSMARNATRMTETAKAQVDGARSHVKAASELHDSFAAHREDLIKQVSDVHALNDASSELLEKQQRAALPLDVEATLQKKDAHIGMLTERLNSLTVENAANASAAAKLAAFAAGHAKASLEHFSDYKEHTLSLLDLRQRINQDVAERTAMEAALDSCRADLQTAFLKLGIDSHVVKIHSAKDGLGLTFVHDPSFGFGGCRVESIQPGSAADATGGIRTGDFVLAVNDAVLWAASFEDVVKAMGGCETNSHIIVGWSSSSRLQ